MTLFKVAFLDETEGSVGSPDVEHPADAESTNDTVVNDEYVRVSGDLMAN